MRKRTFFGVGVGVGGVVQNKEPLKKIFAIQKYITNIICFVCLLSVQTVRFCVFLETKRHQTVTSESHYNSYLLFRRVVVIFAVNIKGMVNKNLLDSVCV